MTNTPIQGKAQCTDGACGEVIQLIVDRRTRQVTHYIVKDNDKPRVERMVPANVVTGSQAGVVYLSCTSAELGGMPPYLAEHVEETEISEYRYTVAASNISGASQSGFNSPTVPMTTTIHEEQIPEGSLALRPGTAVLATDGKVGEMREVVLDQNGVITHFLLVTNRPEGEVGTTLPLSTIDYVGDEGIHIRLDRRQIESLPAIPLRSSKKDGEFPTVELIAIVYDDLLGGQRGLTFVKDLAERHVLQVVHAAVLVKDVDGTARIAAQEDMHKGRSRWTGAITGGMLGILGGPVGIVVGAAAGYGAGAAVEGKVNKGFADPFLDQLKARLQPGKSGLLLIIEHAWAQTDLAQYLGQERGVITQQEMTDRLAAELLVANAGEPPPA